MKISWNWLSRHVDLSGIDPFEFAERFTLSVAELEKVQKKGEGIEDVVVGKILDLKPHPSADKLQVAVCQIREKTATIVSGAPNLRTGAVIPVAIDGAHLPGGVEVKAIKLRGIMSEAVPLSERDMGLSDDHSGVMILPADSRTGAKFVDAFSVKDVVFEIDNKSITHRPDLWSHRGIAREIAALTQRSLKPLALDFIPGKENIIRVKVEDSIRCPRYMAAVYDGIIIRESPFWLKQYLLSAGIRAINNVVDIANFVMMDTGNPVHTFDIRYIEGNEIVIRCAKKGEKIRTLDSIERTLSAEDLIIADRNKAIALAGVMGGENSEIKNDTSMIVLESANFNAASVRRTAMRHGLRTEASAHFEKSLDPEFAAQALGLFSRMILEIIPESRIISPVYDAADFSKEKKKIFLEYGFVSRKLGIAVPPENAKRYLELLDFDVEEKNDGIEVTVPSFRATKDISIPEDLVEEIGRIHGYDRIEPKAPLMEVKWIDPLPVKKIEHSIRTFLSHQCCFSEILSYSFDSDTFLERAGIGYGKRMMLKNPISQDMRYLRSSLVPNLLLAADKNSVRHERFKIYEIGRIFHSECDQSGILKQEKICSGIVYESSGKKELNEEIFYRTKGMIHAMLSELGFKRSMMNRSFSGSYPWIHPAKSISIDIDDVNAGYMAQINPKVLQNLKMQESMCSFELNLDILLGMKPDDVFFTEIPRLPGIPFDLSIIVPEKITAEEMEKIIRKESGDILKNLRIFAIFRGDPIPREKKSVSFNLYFQTDQRTLQIKEVQDIIDRIMGNFAEIGGSLRK
jgi:phenylalanyl-tRNA synthetase beta chain